MFLWSPEPDPELGTSIEQDSVSSPKSSQTGCTLHKHRGKSYTVCIILKYEVCYGTQQKGALIQPQGKQGQRSCLKKWTSGCQKWLELGLRWRVAGIGPRDVGRDQIRKNLTVLPVWTWPCSNGKLLKGWSKGVDWFKEAQCCSVEGRSFKTE